MRINAFLSLAGIASRRKADGLVKAGRVTINETTAELNSRVSEGDTVRLDNQVISPHEHEYVVLNKPVGYVTTLSDPQGRATVMDLVTNKTLKPVGRLDINTQGLLILTNDGQLANRLMHPSTEINKTYRAKVRGSITPEILNKLSIGLELEDGPTAPAKAKKIDDSTLELIIHEGRNRQVRRMMAAVGLRVVRLDRIGYAGLSLSGLARGRSRSLTQAELKRLKQIA